LIEGLCPMCQGKMKEIFVIYEGVTSKRVKLKCEICELEYYAEWKYK